MLTFHVCSQDNPYLPIVHLYVYFLAISYIDIASPDLFISYYLDVVPSNMMIDFYFNAPGQNWTIVTVNLWLTSRNDIIARVDTICTSSMQI